MGIWDEWTRGGGGRRLKRALFGNGTRGSRPRVPAGFVAPPGWTPLMEEGRVPEGDWAHVEAEGFDLAVGKIGGQLRAISNICPHAGGPMHLGTLEGDRLTCPWHRWCFDLRSGECETVPGVMLPVYEVQVVAGVVCARLGG